MKRDNPRTLFLFNDCVVLTEADGKKLKWKDVIPFAGAQLADGLPDGAEPFSFTLTSSRRSYLFLAPTAQNKRDVFAALSAGIWRSGPAESRSSPQWRHQRVTNTLFHAAVTGAAAVASALIPHCSPPDTDADDTREWADVHAVDGSGWSCIQLACWYGHAEVVRLLLSAGAHLASTTPDGRSLTHLAVENGHMEVLTVLLDNEGPVKRVDGMGDSPLCVALCAHGRFPTPLVSSMAIALVSAGSDVNAITHDGRPCVVVAVEADLADVITAMTSKGGATNVRIGPHLLTPLHVAVTQPVIQPDVVVALLKVRPTAASLFLDCGPFARVCVCVCLCWVGGMSAERHGRRRQHCSARPCGGNGYGDAVLPSHRCSHCAVEVRGASKREERCGCQRWCHDGQCDHPWERAGYPRVRGEVRPRRVQPNHRCVRACVRVCVCGREA